MKFKIEASEWSNVLSAASSYNDEAVINLKERGIMLRVQDKSQTGLYNTLIPEGVLEEYEIGEHPRLGIHVDDLNDITPSSSDVATVELENHKIKTTVGSREYRVPNIDPDTVNSEPENVPNLDMPVKITLDPDKLMDFISEAYAHVHNRNSGHFMIQAQKGVFMMWSRKDDYELSEWFHWEDFEDYSIDWDKAKPSQGMSGNPQEEERMTTVLSIPLTKDMAFYSDTARLEMGHGVPLKMVSESESGVKHSWIVPPRFPRDSQPDEIPQRIIKDRNVV